MSHSGFLLYRCRRCGANLREQEVPCLHATLANTTLDPVVAPRAPMHTYHECQTGQLGICDLVGGELKEK